MQQTKFDLCADTVTLDYEELVKTSLIAMRYSLDSLSDQLRKWYDMNPKLTDVDIGKVIDDAEALATASRAYHYLTEGRRRSEVIIKRDEQEGDEKGGE